MPHPILSAETRRVAGVLLVWGVAVIGVLQLHELPYDFGHGICGPWGCGPPLQVLLACHGFWLVSFAAVLWMCVQYASPQWRRRAANLSVMCGLAGLAAVAVWQAVVWWPQVSDWARPYLVQRYFFTVATLVDFPIIELLLFGLICRRAGRRDAELPSDDGDET